MAFSEQFVELIDVIAQKMGVAIDWTNENVMPYLIDLLERYIGYLTGTTVLYSVASLIGTAIGTACLWGAYAFSKKYEDEAVSLFLVIGVATVLFGVVFLLLNVINLVKLYYVPEITIYQQLMS